MKTIPAAYTWSDAEHARDRIAVRIRDGNKPVARVAKQVRAYFSKRENAYIMRPGQFKRFQRAYARICRHPALRVYAWIVDDVLYAGCCDCGQVLQEKSLARGVPLRS